MMSEPTPQNRADWVYSAAYALIAAIEEGRNVEARKNDLQRAIDSTSPVSASRIDPPVPSPGGDTDASDEMLTLATIIDKRIYPTTPTVRVLARDYLRLRAAAVVPSPSAPPIDATGQNRLLLNAYGRACYEAGKAAVSSTSVADSPTQCPTCEGRRWVMRSSHQDLGGGLGAGASWNEACPDCAASSASAEADSQKKNTTKP